MTTGTQVEIDPPSMMLTLVFSILVPVSTGQLARIPARLRAWLDRRKGFLSVTAQLLVLTIILQAVALAAVRLSGSMLDQLPALALLAAICMTIHVTGLALGFLGGRLLRFPRPECVAVGVAGSQKTLPVSMLLISTYFGDYPLAVVPILFYHIGQLVLDTLIVSMLKDRTPASEQTPMRSAVAADSASESRP